MVLIRQDEEILLQEQVKYEHGRGFKIPTGTIGNLIITNKRILFEYSKGLISKSYFLGIDMPLRSINNVTTEGTIFKKLVIEFKDEGSRAIIGNPRVVFSVRNLEEWSNSLRNAIKASID